MEKMTIASQFKIQESEETFVPMVAKITSCAEGTVRSALGKVHSNRFSVSGSVLHSSIGFALYEQATFINHSCNPNCTCKMIEDENRLKHIMIIAKRDIAPGEEITYDYQFAVESEKLACLCGAPNCLGRLN